jgi:membrane protein
MLQTRAARLPALVLRVGHLARYLVLRTETHAYCAALAFFSLVGFYPFATLLLWIARFVVRWRPAETVVLETLREYYPEGKEFLLRNLDLSVNDKGSSWHPITIFWVLLGAAGIFIPLETAFNQVWGVKEHRPYWKNQAVGFLLTAGCCALAVIFVLATAGLQHLAESTVEGRFAIQVLRYLALHLLALAFSVMVIFMFYKLLPNAHVPIAPVLRAAVLAGIVAEGVRFLYQFLLPLLHLQAEHGPYYVSVSFVLLAYFETFVLIGGTYLAAGRVNAEGPGGS